MKLLSEYCLNHSCAVYKWILWKDFTLLQICNFKIRIRIEQNQLKDTTYRKRLFFFPYALIHKKKEEDVTNIEVNA